MTYYDGLVEKVMGDNRVTVVMTPGREGRPDTSEAGNEGCHCTGTGASLRITAVNRADAREGDWVSVSQRRGALAQNAMNLVGLPLLGAVLGAALAGVWTDGVVPSTMVIAFALGGLLLGALLGSSRYRHALPENQPFIGRVVQRREDMADVPYTEERSSKAHQETCCAFHH